MSKINRFHFEPLRYLSSCHLQTIVSSLRPPGAPPPSKRWLVDLDGGDRLSCEVSLPLDWKETDQTVVLVHGLGGSHASDYMIRMARNLYVRGVKVVRVNLRGCGSGVGLSKLPYSGGLSGDVLRVFQDCKKEHPQSKITAIGFSLGGNILLKLSGELGEKAQQWMENCFTVCPPLDLGQSVRSIEKKRHYFYHLYYLRRVSQQARPWMEQKWASLYEFDEFMTAPLWGYKGAQDYYDSCSSIRFLPKICCPTHLVFAEDDPFVDWRMLRSFSLPESVHIWVSKQGGHMGFLGKTAKEYKSYWMDQLLIHWLDGDFSFSLQTP